MSKTKLFTAGIAALLVLGLVVAVNAIEQAREGGCRGFGTRGFMPGKLAGDAAVVEGLGLPEDATHEQVMEALWQKRLSDLGLTEDSTVRELHEAMKARMQERQQEMEAQREQMQEQMKEKRQEMLDKLGLGEDATPEDVRDAMKAYCEQNPDDCPQKGFGGRMGKFGRRGL